jgi:hypothetical protein
MPEGDIPASGVRGQSSWRGDHAVGSHRVMVGETHTEYLKHYDDHRPHLSRGQRPPNVETTVAGPITDLADLRSIRQQPILWVPAIRPPPCDLGVFGEEAAESVSSGDLDVGIDRVWESAERAALFSARCGRWLLRWGSSLSEDLAQVAGVHDEDPVQEFATYAADPAFHERVHGWSLRSGDDPDSSARKT